MNSWGEGPKSIVYDAIITLKTHALHKPLTMIKKSLGGRLRVCFEAFIME
jgi:hypothetical protein